MTLKEIASAAGVSMATVSRVINRSGYVNEKTYQRVMEVATEGGYFRDRRANKKPGNLVAVVVPDLANPFFVDVIRGIRSVVEKEKKEIIVMDSQEKVQVEKRILSRIQGFDLCGLVITPITDSGEEAEGQEALLKSMDVPVVLVDRDVKNAAFDGVFVDNVMGAFEGTSFLIQSGFREIAIVAGPRYSKPGRERVEGYLNALDKYRIPAREDWILEGDFSMEGGYALTNALLDQPSPPKAIFSCNNLMTLGCIRALRDRKMEIGGDDGFAVVGFDEVEALDVLGMKVPTVKRPTVEMGKTAAELLMRQVKDNGQSGESPRRRIVLAPRLEIND